MIKVWVAAIANQSRFISLYHYSKRKWKFALHHVTSGDPLLSRDSTMNAPKQVQMSQRIFAVSPLNQASGISVRIPSPSMNEN